MTSRLQRILDWCFYARRTSITSIAFVTLRVYGLEVEYDDVKAGTFKSRTPVPLRLDEAQDIDLLLDLAKDSVANADARRTIITDKCKTLLTLGSLLLGLIGLLLPKYLAFDPSWMRWLSAAAIAILFNAIVLLLMFFDIGTEMDVSLTQEDIPLNATDLKKSFLNQYLECAAASENRTDYLVELYRASRFCFLSALTVVAGLVLASVVMNSPKDQTEQIVRELRANSTLTNLLRGPKGDEGRKGDRGDQGLKGERGNDSNASEVATLLISDTRFRDLIQKAIEAQSKNASKP